MCRFDAGGAALSRLRARRDGSLASIPHATGQSRPWLVRHRKKEQMSVILSHPNGLLQQADYAPVASTLRVRVS